MNSWCFNNKNVFTAIKVVYINGGPAKNGKTGHSGLYDLRIERYKIKI